MKAYIAVDSNGDVYIHEAMPKLVQKQDGYYYYSK